MDPLTIGMMAVGLIDGAASSKSAKKDRRAALALQRDILTFNQKRYDDYKSLYGDLEQQLVADAKKGVVADVPGVTRRAVADVTQQFRGAEDKTVRALGRYGINPNSGRAESAVRDSNISQAVATAGLVNQQRETERRRAEEQTWARRASVTNLGVTQMNNAAGGVTSAMGGIADTYNQSANAKAQEASQMFGAAGMMLGMGLGRGTPGAGGSGAKSTGGVQAPQPLGVAPDQIDIPAWSVGRENQLLQATPG